MRQGLLGGAIAALLACGVSSIETYPATGVVLEVHAEQGRVRIAHDEIADLMPAMTMDFAVASPELLDRVEPGARVRFDLERRGNLFRITALEVTGEAGVSDGASREPPESPEVAPDFSLVDQDGQPLRLSDLRGETVLLSFIFTRCPGPCPILTSTHLAAQRQLPPEVSERTRFVSISLDPEYDTPERLRAYAEARGADLPTWSFLTGDRKLVEEVLRRYHVGSYRQPDGSLDHTLVTLLIDPQGRIVRRYIGDDDSAERIAADLQQVR